MELDRGDVFEGYRIEGLLAEGVDDAYMSRTGRLAVRRLEQALGDSGVRSPTR